MMRELKMRVWCPIPKRMFYHGDKDILIVISDEDVHVEVYTDHSSEPSEIYKGTLMLGVGVTDKDGKDVYEKDYLDKGINGTIQKVKDCNGKWEAWCARHKYAAHKFWDARVMGNEYE